MATPRKSTTRAHLDAVDPVWRQVRQEAEEAVAREPALGGFIFATVLNHDRLEEAVCHRLAQRIHHSDVDAALISQTFDQILARQPELGDYFRADLNAEIAHKTKKT